MKDAGQTKAHIRNEIEMLRQRVVELETIEIESKRAEKKLLERTHDLTERIKELDCLYNISDLVEKPGISLPEIFQGTVDLMPSAWQYPEITNARIVLEGQAFETKTFRETVWRQVCHILVSDEPIGCVEVFYGEERPERNEGPFLKEERALLNAIAERLGRIIERFWTEEALRESEGTARALLNALSDVGALIDAQGNILDANEAMAQRFGKNVDGLIGIHGWDLLPPDLAERRKAYVDQVIQSRKPCRFEDEHQGTWFDNVFYPICDLQGKVTRIAVLARDITERKRVEKALQESEERFRSLYENAAIGLYRTSLDGSIQMANPALISMLGYSSFDELAHRNLEEMGFEPSYPRSEFRQLIDREGQIVGLESAWVRQDGTTLFVRESAKTVKDEGGKILYYEGTVEDISESKRAEDAFRKSLRTLSTLMSNLPGIVYRCQNDRNWTIEFVSDGCLELSGYQPYDLMNNSVISWAEIIHPDDRESVWNDVQDAVRDRRPFQLTYRIITRSGQEKWVWEQGAADFFSPHDELALEGLIIDITEREQLKLQLLQSEKMSSLGQLISGVAHELNNPMASVLGFSQLLLGSEEITESTRRTLEKINMEADRARKIVQNLLTVARQRKPEKRKVQITDTLQQILDLRAYEMKVNNIEVERNFDPGTPFISVDGHQIQQVFLNIIMNAEQAMLEAHGKGRLKVVTQCDEERGNVRISFHDDGPGIPKEHLSKIFDPFFTTKPVGKGTGLGLSVSYGIIQEHGGHITAVNEKSGGAIFTVELPLSGNHCLGAVPEQPRAESRGVVGGKKILVVDDEAAVVDLVRMALEREGHVVETAHSGQTALQKIEKDNFDVIITDLKMPGKNGIDVYMFCTEKMPHLTKRFLFLTGDIAAPESQRFIEEYKVPYLSKPFNVTELTSFIHTVFQDE